MSTQPSASGQTPRTDEDDFGSLLASGIRKVIAERDAALHRITELESQNVALAIEAAEKLRVVEAERDQAQFNSDEKDTRIDEAHAERDAALRERDELRQRLDTMAATMFPIQPS